MGGCVSTFHRPRHTCHPQVLGFFRKFKKCTETASRPIEVNVMNITHNSLNDNRNSVDKKTVAVADGVNTAQPGFNTVNCENNTIPELNSVESKNNTQRGLHTVDCEPGLHTVDCENDTQPGLNTEEIDQTIEDNGMIGFLFLDFAREVTYVSYKVK